MGENEIPKRTFDVDSRYEERDPQNGPNNRVYARNSQPHYELVSEFD